MSPSAADALRGLGSAAASRAAPFVRLDGAVRGTGEAAVAEEVPVALVYNGRPHAVMFATPADFEDFAVGFSLAEAVVARAEDVERIEVVRFAAGVELQLTIPEGDAARLARRTRALAGRTGCGLCGVEQVADALRVPATPVRSTLRVRPAALWRAAAELEARQSLNRTTHAVHAAGFADADGALATLREDVGRHNALDKLLGALARQRADAGAGFAVVTSRASVELVQKAAAAGVPLLAAVSRPTALAIRVAELAGVTLVGLLRGTSANVYAGDARLVDD